LLREFWRRFALIAGACIFLFAALAEGQQIDFAVGGGILESPKLNNSSLSFEQPPEKGGIYPSVNADFVGFRNRRLGLRVETSWRYGKANYPSNGETYRPIFTDVSALFQPQLTRKLGLDLMGGVGLASTRFYLPNAAICTVPGGGCINYTSSNHFMEDLGAGLRYYVWHRIPHVFVRPEIHYYHIQNNNQFHSDSVARVGASIGYTFGSK